MYGMYGIDSFEGPGGRRLATLIESSPIAIVCTDSGGDITLWNPRAEGLFGWTGEEVLGRTMPHVPPEGRREYRALASGENPGPARIECRTKSGEKLLVSAWTSPLEDERGEIEGSLAMMLDLSGKEEASRQLESLARRNHMILESAGEGIYGVDREMNVTFANPAVTRMTGWSAREMVGEDLHRFINRAGEAGERPLAECPVYRTLTTGQTHRITRDTLFRKDGTSFPAEYSCNPILEDGEITGAVIVFQDTTGRRRRERLLKEREERFRVLFQNSSDVVFIIDRGEVIRYASPSSERVMGYRPEDLVGRNALDLVHPADHQQAKRVISEVRRKGGLSDAVELRWSGRDGPWRVYEVVTNNLLHEPSVRGMVLNARDVTERKTLEDALSHQAFHDSLTNLPNRSLFMDRLDQALKRSRRQTQAVAALFMDLDNFKVINDTLGHDAGDSLLVEISHRIQNCLREADTAARFGGDEFTILLEDLAGEQDALLVAQRIQDELREPFVLAGREVFVTSSIGVSLNIVGNERPQDLLRHADIAVYHAKGQGRDRYTVFEPQMNAWALEQMVLGNDLKRALEREELVLLYQPKVSLGDGSTTGVEALLYWDHPERGRLKPLEFIPLAEETGMIIPIGRWVILEACRRMRDWQRDLPNPPAHVSVNLSMVQLRSRDLIADVREILEETGVAPKRLAMEVTESLLMEDVHSAVETLRGLKDLGVRIEMDDFGTGYSSLSALKNLPLDILKVDKSFIDGLHAAGRDVGIVRAVVDLAHTLGLKVTAEGVETAEQFSLLREMGCESAQGFHISRPVPAEAVVDLFGPARSW